VSPPAGAPRTVQAPGHGRRRGPAGLQAAIAAAGRGHEVTVLIGYLKDHGYLT